jgi:peptidoglycan/LPS O-acetylase OafA/YrhL
VPIPSLEGGIDAGRIIMRSRTVAVWAGVIAGVGLLAKVGVMAVQGGPEPETSIPENIAFFTGNIALVIAAASAGAFLARHRPMVWRGLAAMAAVIAVAAVLGAGQALLTALPGDSWWQGESIFGLLGVAALAVASWAARLTPSPGGDSRPS